MPLIEYIFHNWIDLETLLVLIFILMAMYYCTNFICDRVVPLLSKIDDNLVDTKLLIERLDRGRNMYGRR